MAGSGTWLGGLPGEGEPNQADDHRAGAFLPAFARIAILSIPWLTALGLVAFLVPKFAALFSRLRETAELPAVTEWLLGFAWLNAALFFLPSVLVLVVLALADISMASLLQGSARKWLYWLWCGGAVAAGCVVAAMVTIALLLPVLKMSASL